MTDTAPGQFPWTPPLMSELAFAIRKALFGSAYAIELAHNERHAFQGAIWRREQKRHEDEARKRREPTGKVLMV